MNRKKAIVIGAGVAGLATAARLANIGFEVIVFEINSEPGGKLTAFEKKGFHFDAGPSLFTAPNLLNELFEFCGEKLDDFFSYQKQEIAFKYFYEDGTIINAFSDSKKFATELKNKVNESETAVESYLENSKKLYESTGEFFLNNSLHKFRTYYNKNVLKALKGVRFFYINSSLNQYNEKVFQNPKTVQLFNRFATYNGSSPYKAPAMLSLIPHLEHNDGTYYPKGGMISITKALYNLCIKKGVVCNFNLGVDRIISHSNTVKGVVVNGENYYADCIVSNCDVYFTYKNLLNDKNAAAKILKQERSSSAVIFYWGINAEFEQLDLHNILFSDDYAKEFKSIFDDKNLFDDPTIYINITSKYEPNIQAPNGKENWFVMVNVPSQTTMNWDDLIPLIKKNVINKINKILETDIEKFIEVEEVLHPSLIESKTSSYLGSLYGTSSNSKLAAFLRHSNFSNNYKGLYFVGGSVHPGGGIPLCLKSAKITCEIIENK
jgi:phytoene desaturase